MRIITVGDIHGRDSWKPVVHDLLMGRYDKVVFLGDYLDSFTVNNNDMIKNLKQLLFFKKAYSSRVTLLVGNHELQYLLRKPHESNPYKCSGYRGDLHYLIHPILKENFNLFQAAFQMDDYLWTHAGLHIGWANQYLKDTPIKELAIVLNEMYLEEDPNIFQVGHLRGGYKDVGGPFWADKRETSGKPYKGIHQIVGHTPVKVVTTVEKSKGTSITYCDCLEYNKSFYKLVIK